MRLANLVSYLLHPVFMPFMGILIIFNSGLYVSELPMEFKRFVYMLVVLCTVVLPLTVLPALYLLKNIRSFTLNERRERIIPLFFTALCFYFAYYMIARFSPVRLINLFLLASTAAVLLMLVITAFWKMSIHMMGLGGICALISILSIAFHSDMTIYLAIVILATGIVASSRLKLKAHKPLQLVLGFIAGFAVIGGILFRVIP